MPDEHELNAKARRGVEIVASMLGQDLADRLAKTAASGRFGARSAGMALEHAFADAWGDERISRREKSMVVIAALVAARQPEELAMHVQAGLANGLTLDDFDAVITQLIPYVGLPASASARRVIVATLRQAGRSTDYAAQSE